MSRNKNRIGECYGEWTIIGNIDNGKYLAKCSCGNAKYVVLSNLTRKLSTNCGCIQVKKAKERNTTHGHSKTNLYKVWRAIRNRCHNANDKSYKNYGARGITVCIEWDEDFESFLNWSLKNGYQQGLEIDRIDVNGNYEPENCRYITKKQNSRNKRTTRYLIIDGIEKTESEWEEEFNLRKGLIKERIDLGWKKEQLLLPTNANGDGRFKNNIQIVIDGISYTVSELSDKFGINPNTIRSRVQMGLTGKDIIKQLEPRNTPKEVICIETGLIYESIKKASLETNINYSCIKDTCRGKLKTAGGYKWSYVGGKE